MIFIRHNNFASGYLRASQVAETLGVPALVNDLPDDVSRETIVFVKDANPYYVKKAKEQGCKIVYDPIDQFAYSDRLRWKDWYGTVDTAIAYNEEMAGFLKMWFKDIVIIPHQWDNRLSMYPQAEHDSFKPAYIGYQFNCPPIVAKHGVTMVHDLDQMIPRAHEFNCHVSIREPDSLESKMKPATKVVTAAAVGAVIITTPDASARELLPRDYPYWCMTVDSFPKILEKAKKEFGTEVWDKALKIMDEVKDKTSIYAIAEKYKNL